jgi:hypothetical protein
MLRYALNVHYPEVLTMRDLATRTGIPPVSAVLRQRRQRLLGHVLRRHGRGEANPLAAVVLHPPQEGFRRGQAQTKTIVENFIMDLAEMNLTPSEAVFLSSQLFRERVCARAL